MRRNHVFCLIIASLLLLAYSNSFENSFQHDDIHTIVRNPFVKDHSKIPQFFLSPKMGSGIYGETSSYRPLLMASFAFNYFLGGLNVFGYHVFNFVLHLLCTVLVYFITLKMLLFTSRQAEPRSLRFQLTALGAALVFGLHPLQTESVTYISGRSSAMTGLFFLASFLTFLQYRAKREIQYWIFSCLLYACSLLVKETAITLLPILVLFQWMFPEEGTFPKRYRVILPYLLLSLIYFLLRNYFFGSLQFGSQPVRPIYENLLSQTRAWVHYLGTLILPLNLNVDYDFAVSHSILESQVVLSIFLLVFITLFIWRLSRSNRVVGFFALWFAFTLLPTNSVIALEDLVSDRWLYLSSVGYAVLLAMAADWIFQKRIEQGRRSSKLVFFFLCALVVEWYCFSTLLRNVDWTSQRTLWEDAVAKSPNKARTYNGLGLAYLQEDRLEEASQYFQKAITLEPQGGQAYLNLGYVYSLQGDYDKAIKYYEQAIPLNPRLLSEIYNNIGLSHFHKKRMEECERYLRKAIEIRPHNPAPHYNLGLYFEEKGEMDRAISLQETAAKLAPDYHLPYEALSRLYQKKGWKEKSQEAYRRFLKHSPRPPTGGKPGSGK